MPLVGPSPGLDFENMPVLGPNIETATDSAIGADGFGLADARFAHGRFGFGNFQDRSVAGFRLDALNDIDHSVQRGLRQRGHKARLPEHRFFHQRVAGADGDAMAA